jgi:hypothetical protein
MSGLVFGTEKERDIALAISLSKLMYLWWFYTSDNLNVTKQTIESFPIALEYLTDETREKLLKLGETIKTELPLNIEFTLYRDRKVGRYVIPNLFPLIKQVDKAIANEFAFLPDMRVVELAFRSARKGEEVSD